jgi:acyl-[acyl-carrier-protein]-phospholipid O-acyltransferase/long-chain-fatty-acid--[acyl-carrier-protein] ligase
MSLFQTRRFLPLFITQFLGALNDNLLKNAMIMLVTYRIAVSDGGDAQTLVTLAAGLFILPFFLFSATAGQLADKYDRAALARIIKLVEIGIMAVASVGFFTGSTWILLAALFGMGTHSSFFGPIKYALLPQQLHEDELLQGNGYIEAGTFLAILLGTILGGVLVLRPHGVAVVSAVLLLVAVSGYVASRRIPAAAASEPDLRINRNIWQETGRIIAYSRTDSQIFLCILGISWFWLVGATLLAEFAPFVKDVLHADAAVVTLLLTVFSVGVGIGSFLCNRLLRGHIQATYVPLAALAITVFGVDLYFTSRGFPPAPEGMRTLWRFAAMPRAWRILADLMLLAISGGIYIVPLYATMQHRSPPAHRARVIAANNVINSLFMVAAALITLALLSLSFTIPDVFLAVSLANFLVAIYICKLLPDALVRSILRMVLTFLFRVEIKGLQHYSEAGERVLIIANHTSFLDAALIAAFLPEKLHFAVNSFIAKKWWMKLALMLVDAFPVDPTNPLATKSLIDLIKKDKKCMIFPEGRLTVTGALMKIYEGPGMIADKSGANLLPIRIDGAQYSRFSRLKGKVRRRWFPKITLTVLPPHQFDIPDEIKGRARRQLASAQLYDVMSEMMFDSTDTDRTLFAALAGACDIHGGGHIIAEDVERKPLSYRQFLLRAFTLGRVLNRIAPDQPAMGIMLPNLSATAIVFFAMQAFGKVPAMINFSTGGAAMISACKVAQLGGIITARRFVKTAKLDGAIADLEGAGVNILYLEEIAGKVGLADKILGLLASRFNRLAYRFTGKNAAPESPAVILYTSGSEGTPKGVVLSHKNILANCSQLASRVDFGPQDKVLNILPMFHSFGLTGGTLLPILSGIKTFYYPSPLHYRIIPELIYDTNSTIMFGTDTFLSAYARFAHPYDMNSVRYIFAGAEKLRDETRRIYADKYGVRIFEGYGATEMSPVISINAPMQNRPGTVGRFLPGLRYRLAPVPGIEEGGLLALRGPNVMLGYLRAELPGVIQPPEDGWYDTGDIVTVDAQGYVTIKGRQKRFAKIGGEMVSLSAVEASVASLWPAHKHAVVSLPDARKGEQIILLTEHEGAMREALVNHFRAEKIAELALPKKIIFAPALPVLGTGKVDYQRAKSIAVEHAGLLPAGA